jgi:hypothetical protein
MIAREERVTSLLPNSLPEYYMKEGRKEGRKDCMKEGRKDYMKEGRKARTVQIFSPSANRLSANNPDPAAGPNFEGRTTTLSRSSIWSRTDAAGFPEAGCRLFVVFFFVTVVQPSSSSFIVQPAAANQKDGSGRCV